MDAILEHAIPVAMRAVRGVAMWLLASGILYAAPFQSPRFIFYGFVVGAMSFMNATRNLAGAALFVLLAYAIAAPVWPH